MAILGIDVGGTFTDAVLLTGGELRTVKIPTVRAQEHSVVKAAVAVGADAGQLHRFTHGTTIATNALLERKGARTAFIGTAGFERFFHAMGQKTDLTEPQGIYVPDYPTMRAAGEKYWTQFMPEFQFRD